MSRKLLLWLLSIPLIVLAIGVGLFYLGVWSVGQAFSQAHLDGLAMIMEAAVGRSLAPADVRLDPVNISSDTGVLEYYKKHPGEVRKDADIFKVWISSLQIADLSLQHKAPESWESSEDVSWVPPDAKSDPWGHPFCLKVEQGTSIVVSPGPNALSALECSRMILLSEDALKGLKPGRLNKHSSGALVLFLSDSERHLPRATQ